MTVFKLFDSNLYNMEGYDSDFTEAALTFINEVSIRVVLNMRLL